MNDSLETLAKKLDAALAVKARLRREAEDQRASRAAAAKEEERKQRLPAEIARAEAIIAETYAKLLDDKHNESDWLRVMSLTRTEVKFTCRGRDSDTESTVTIADTAAAATIVANFLRNAGLQVYIWKNERDNNFPYSLMATKR